MAKNVMKNITAPVHQMEQARPDQVQNNAGGYVFQLDPWKMLDRFLVLGTEAGSYYCSEKKMTKENAKVILDLIKQDGKRVTDRTVEISQKGLAFKQEPTIFVMALLTTAEDKATKKYAISQLDKVLRISTFLFTYTAYVLQLRGWGRSLRKIIANWYNDMDAAKLAVQVTKYQSRSLEGEKPWSHRDLLRLSHAYPVDSEHNFIYKYVTQGVNSGKDGKSIPLAEFNALENNPKLGYIWAHEQVKKIDKPQEIINLINKYHLTHESIPSEKQTKEVWEQLVQKMPMTATIRNLGRMTNMGVLAPMNKNVNLVCERITDDEAIEKSRIHPMSILIALKTYSQGQGFKGKLTWKPIPKVIDALDEAFYKAFKNVEPTGKRILLAVDCSGSMSSPVMGMDCLSSRDVCATIGMAIAKKETNSHILGFCHRLMDLGISPKMRLDDVINKMNRNDWGATDCALPMIWAIDNKVEVDAFVIITDGETYYDGGEGHSYQALQNYRKKFVKDAKRIILATTSTGFSIADPQDRNSLDIVGFSSDVPTIINKFIRGEI
jgi:60 kDa SS-A/Ro ribonucleoprotein